MTSKISAHELAKQLTMRPIKEKGDEIPHIQLIGENNVHQADLLFLPNDKGFKYALVVVDLGSRLTDAIPLKEKTAPAVLSGLKKIYKRGILELPKLFQCDPGSEFKGVVKKYLLDNDVSIRYGKTGRSRQQALVERRNYSIGKEILFRQLQKEIATKKVNKQWLKDLPEIIEELNEHYEVEKPIEPKSDMPLITKRNSELLWQGDKVRTILDKPENYFGKKLNGNFRASDIRWSREIYPIDRLLLRPNFPPMYLVNGVAYTRGQIQPVENS